MEFRPCIDIHNGKVKQIVGSTLTDKDNQAVENFIAVKSAAEYAVLYREKNIRGGHIILLNPPSSEYYEATRKQAFSALNAYPNAFQVGGGVNDQNALEYLDAGASHVIVTSFVFQGGQINLDNLERMCRTVGREHLVLDVSCRKKGNVYYIVTDRWQKFTEEAVNHTTLDMLAEYCDEFLVHAVDVEGKNQGIEQPLVEQLGRWSSTGGKIPITYAGGIHCYEDIDLLKRLGNNRINITIGSGLDLFGGTLEFDKVLERVNA